MCSYLQGVDSAERGGEARWLAQCPGAEIPVADSSANQSTSCLTLRVPLNIQPSSSTTPGPCSRNAPPGSRRESAVDLVQHPAGIFHQYAPSVGRNGAFAETESCRQPRTPERSDLGASATLVPARPQGSWGLNRDPESL